MMYGIAVVFIFFSILILKVFSVIIKKLNFLINQNKTIIMTNEEAVGKITALTAQVGKIGTEVQALKDVITSQGNVSPEVEAALANLENAVKGVDDLNPDAPATPE